VNLRSAHHSAALLVQAKDLESYGSSLSSYYLLGHFLARAVKFVLRPHPSAEVLPDWRFLKFDERPDTHFQV
jgi:hypothetical protein